MDTILFLLHHMAQFMPQMALLSRPDMHLSALGIGQRSDLSGLIGIVMHPHIIKGQSAALLEVQLHLRGDAGQVRPLLYRLFLGSLDHLLFHVCTSSGSGTHLQLFSVSSRAKGRQTSPLCW